MLEGQYTSTSHYIVPRNIKTFSNYTKIIIIIDDVITRPLMTVGYEVVYQTGCVDILVSIIIICSRLKTYLRVLIDKV